MGLRVPVTGFWMLNIQEYCFEFIQNQAYRSQRPCTAAMKLITDSCINNFVSYLKKMVIVKDLDT